MKSRQKLKWSPFPKQEAWDSIINSIDSIRYIRVNIYSTREESINYKKKSESATLWTFKAGRGYHKGKFRYHLILKNFETCRLADIKKRIMNIIRYLRLEPDEIICITAYARVCFRFYMENETNDSIRAKIENSKGMLQWKVEKPKSWLIIRLRCNKDSICIRPTSQMIYGVLREIPQYVNYMLNILEDAEIEVQGERFGRYLESTKIRKRKFHWRLIQDRMKFILVSLAEGDKTQKQLADELKQFCNYVQTWYAIGLLEKKYGLISTRREERTKAGLKVCTLTDRGKEAVRKIQEEIKIEKQAAKYPTSGLGSLTDEDVREILASY